MKYAAAGNKIYEWHNHIETLQPSLAVTNINRIINKTEYLGENSLSLSRCTIHKHVNSIIFLPGQPQTQTHTKNQ